MGRIMEWGHSVSSWAFGSAWVFSFVAIALFGLWLVNFRIRQRTALGETLIDNNVVGWFFSGVFTLYGITLGLIAVATWENSSRVTGVASHEAAAIAALYRDVGGFPSPLREELRTKLREYTQFVVEKAWPAQQRGEILEGGSQDLNDFQSRLFASEPETESAKILNRQALETFNQMIELRRQRIEAVDGGIPGAIWAVILIGGLLTISSSYCFQLKQFSFHALLCSGLAAMVGLLVFLIAALDRPYRGAVSVSPAPYELVLERLMR
jgi:hypothetical protein